MKKLILFVTCLFLFTEISSMSFSQTIKVMSFNIRYDNPGDGKNSWENRRNEMIKLIDYYHPDFLGLQEALINPLKYISDGLKSYSYIGVGREDGKEKGEFAPILYDTSIYELMKNKTFWLSEQPDKVSIGWDAALERICTYGSFKEKKSGKVINVFNTHFDHMGNKARMMSAKLILTKIEEFVKDNSMVLFMGDLNCEFDSDPIKIIKEKLNYGADFSPKGVYGPIGTFNGFNEGAVVSEKIDFIFEKNVSVINYRHIDDKMTNNNYISDHYPVLLEFKEK
jgi:endonuclease/exonuclease/phosphatase family metal-dependent hydrolase